MYGVDLSVQIENLMPFLGLGFILGIVYDAAGIVRNLFVKLKFIVFVVDFLFCILSAVLTYLLLLATANGFIRIYLLLALFTGAAVYFSTLGVLVSFVTVKFSKFLRRIFTVIFSPFYCVLKKLSAVLHKMKEKILKKIEISKNKLKKPLKDE